MTSTISTPTSCSEQSIYFDAPLASISMMNGFPTQAQAPPETESAPLVPPVQSFNPNVNEISDNPFQEHQAQQPPPPHDLEPMDHHPNELDSEPRADQGFTTQPNESEGWLPATDAAPEPNGHKKGSILKPSGSLSRSVRRGGSVRDRDRPRSLSQAESVSRKSIAFSEAAFSNGPGTQPIGAGPEGDEDIINRAATANDALTPKQKSKILKAEAKDNKRLSKIIKDEGKVEKASLSIAIDELAELQKIQRTAVKNEAKSFSDYTKLRTAYQKLETSFIMARTRYDAAQAQLDAEANALETWRGTAREATDRMHEKSKEVENLRALCSVDEREREVRLSQLTGGKRSWL
ncbi:hypothetical protein BDN72DRAFT_832528 [Pluteus cervinus]|uniref:Uncharacterized protein n=1 Tax=Pluteus cervinus TaxID=181527 RepID=A0ACD3BC49_9AGAR|nr:hypothetical protein BDN72DRAFT_832528 [Pluteus cervinus]